MTNISIVMLNATCKTISRQGFYVIYRMDSSIDEKMAGFGPKIIACVNIITLTSELIFGWLCVFHYFTVQELVYFYILIGILGSTSIIIQLISMCRYFIGRPCEFTPTRVIGIVVLHILQCGLFLRYTRILVARKSRLSTLELQDTFLLRLIHCISCSLPMIILSIHALLDAFELDGYFKDSWWTLCLIFFTLVSTSWGILCYSSYTVDCLLSTEHCSVCKMTFTFLHRLCELGGRTLVLAMFARVHGYWTFLVIGLHCVTAFILNLIQSKLQKSTRDAGVSSKLICIIGKSIAYIFCYLNLLRNKYSAVIYYTIVCLENVTLLVLWVLVENYETYHIPLCLLVILLYISGLGCCATSHFCFITDGLSVEKDSTPADVGMGKQRNVNVNMCDRISPDGNDSHVFQMAPGLEEVQQMCDYQHRSLSQIHLDQQQPYFQIQTARSITPIVLMDTVRNEHLDNAYRARHSHSRASSLDFIWDNYDLHLPRRNQDYCSKHPPCVRKQTYSPTLDHGYFSSMSSSSTEKARRRETRHSQQCRQHSSGRVLRTRGHAHFIDSNSPERAVKNSDRRVQHEHGVCLSADDATMTEQRHIQRHKRRATVHVTDRSRLPRRPRLMDLARFNQNAPESIDQLVASIFAHSIRLEKTMVAEGKGSFPNSSQHF